MLRRMVINQGGDVRVIDDPSLLPSAPVQTPLPSPSGGYVVTLDAESLGRASVALGAGRLVKGAAIDYRVGFVLHKKVGDAVAAGEPLLTIHAVSEQAAREIAPPLLAAYAFSPNPPPPLPLTSGVVR